MALISREDAYQRFLQHGRNSSHFVWLLEEHCYFESSEGWVFCYLTRGEVTLLALEPLIPGAPTEYTPEHEAQFARAWEEFRAFARPKTSAFVSVYAPFLKLLHGAGFQTVRIGHEPWVLLEDCIPRGNSGKGVRSARNQALRSGLAVSEWNAKDVSPANELGREMQGLLDHWKNGRLLQLSGFLNKVDPFAFAESRRYFGVRSATGRLEAYLVATPVPGIGSYFLEDLVIRDDAARGAGELITLEAMVALRDSGAMMASLGVVSVTTAGAEAGGDAGRHEPPSPILFLLEKLPRFLSRFYNFDGLEVFRKRFKPHRWESIYLAVSRHEEGKSIPPRSGNWIRALAALLGAFRPRLRISARYLSGALLAPLRRHALSSFVLALSTLIFGLVNRWDLLPETVLSRFAFTADAPVVQWLMRSLVSDYLYFDRTHFLCCALGLWVTLRWAERCHKQSFLIPAFALFSVLDDFVNYLVVIKPFSMVNQPLFQKLVAMKDVGGSLALASFLGLQLCQFRRNREVVFAVLVIASVLLFAYNSSHFKDLVVNLNHALFLSIGFIAGKVKFELARRKNEKASKGKPPKAKCVAPAKVAAQAGTGDQVA